MRLTFFLKLCLLRALTPKGFEDTFAGIERLNELRNKMAHNLSPEGLEDSVKKFLETVEDQEDRSKYEGVEIGKRLTSGISVLCGGVSGMVGAMQATPKRKRLALLSSKDDS